MSKLINLSIDLTKIDKSKINNHPNGSKYYSITVELKDEADAYGNNVSAWNAQTKEERAAKANRQFIGNGKVIWEILPVKLRNHPLVIKLSQLLTVHLMMAYLSNL